MSREKGRETLRMKLKMISQIKMMKMSNKASKMKISVLSPTSQITEEMRALVIMAEVIAEVIDSQERWYVWDM